MCIFSGTVSSVANTRIFAHSSTSGRQFLVYSMQYEAGSDLAMILPLPTPPFPPEDAVRFIDLSGYPDFFDDMATGFYEPALRGLGSKSAPTLKGILKVHEVGSFQASFVPHLRDFARLDSRFRLPDQTWEQMPLYHDYAFAVFKLRAGAKTSIRWRSSFPEGIRRSCSSPRCTFTTASWKPGRISTMRSTARRRDVSLAGASPRLHLPVSLPSPPSDS